MLHGTLFLRLLLGFREISACVVSVAAVHVNLRQGETRLKPMPAVGLLGHYGIRPLVFPFGPRHVARLFVEPPEVVVA